ncbi:Ankyrin repeat domain-containing protein [Tetrabaena socialis]|uniref:Ankyrin repeat domain-containing protein n=1 Tax=Tetrabaena socialis TaxID=47790 RepID=A0A2J8ABY0_9CHLO|nr:Ankyrin repeat domain-containing protein [Tetrabaena socialis]|eukprot:PNH10034.1 Ankyrin repeat domain-containing protein [Tetrabaena socialis]
MAQQQEPERQKVRLGAEPSAHLHQAGAPASTCDPALIWLPEIVQRFVKSLPPNVVAGTLRLVDKATAAQFRGPQHTTIQLSQPVPHHAFAWRWAGPAATRSLTRTQREMLPLMTARNGVVANLGVLLAREDHATDPVKPSVSEAAASAGQLDVCRWLRREGCAWRGSAALEAAAKGGHEAVCEWLLDEGVPLGDAAGTAALGGHVSLMLRLLRVGRTSLPNLHRCNLMKGVAAGCNLAVLQDEHRTVFDGREVEELDDAEHELRDSVKDCLINAAITGFWSGTHTADWQAKVDWLEEQGYHRPWDACELTAASPDALPRLQWLLQRGYPVDNIGSLASSTAGAGNAAALRFLLDQEPINLLMGCYSTMHASEGGHVAVLEVLHAAGFIASVQAVKSAAGGGHLPAVAWLVERLGAAMALTDEVFAAAAGSGSMELLSWLRARGCPWDERAFAAAAEHGSEEQLEWLAEQGCPMGDDGEPYVRAAFTGSVALLECVRRLGCRWSPDGSTMTRAVHRSYMVDAYRSHEVWDGLRWLLDQGCPVDWAAAEAAAAARPAYFDGYRPMVEWLQVLREAEGLRWVAAAAREGPEGGEVVAGDISPWLDVLPWCLNQQ